MQNRWNIYNWRDKKQYQFLEGSSNKLFRWEFHRRRPDYRKRWLEEARKELPYSDGDLLRERDLMIPLMHDGLIGMPNPTNPKPKELRFISKPRGFEAFFGVEDIEDIDWIHITLNIQEFAFLVDLSREPIGKLFARVNGGRILDRKKHPSQRDILFSARDTRVKVKRKLPPYGWQPRILTNPRDSKDALVIFNQALPVGPQWEFAKNALEELQKPFSFTQRRKRRESWITHLRILDAREINVSYSEIGNVLFKNDYATATGQAQKAYDNAKRVRDNFPI